MKELLKIRDNYLLQEKTAKVAQLLGYITEGEYREALKRRQLTEAAILEIQDWQKVWLNSLRKEGEMNRKDVVAKLKQLREELEGNGADILTEIPLGILLMDICQILDLDHEEQVIILGEEGQEQLTEFIFDREYRLMEEEKAEEPAKASTANS